MNSRQIDVRHEFGSVDVDVSFRFESPSYLTDHKVGNASSCYQMFRPLDDFDSSQEDDANYQHRDTLHSLVQSSFHGNQVLNLQGNSIRSLFEQHQSSTHSFSSIDKNFEVNGLRIFIRNSSTAKKATPKGILKLMNCEGLTIIQVKSHLQKYRFSRYISESREGKGEKPICAYSTTQLDAEMGTQIVEALRLQIDFQRRLYEQLECQRKLQTRIEEQAKQLKTMFECKVKTT
ncbi:myb family transcription factor PHL5-like [Olea europaea subsp. europaea]|uniref:Myb family transcription factor PHL5-like n=1 Tax=Olea europaea subsp. europaea TaxID=158383 RepID=A0A8S0PWY6_OLEEU|nr:myb family transcription factor PHL5-like [Olea europaea subsp. europaea]